MHKKYRRKNFSNIFIVVVAIIIMSLFGVGYSIFSTELTINGTAIAKATGQDIPVVIEPTTPGGTEYVSITVDNNVLEVTSQTINGNTVNIDLKAIANTGKPRTMSMSMDFINNTEYTYTNGTVAYEVTGNTTFVQTQPTKTVPTTLQPGETGTLSISFSNAKFNSLVTSCTCTFTVTYTANGQDVQFIVVLNFTR